MLPTWAMHHDGAQTNKIILLFDDVNDCYRPRGIIWEACKMSRRASRQSMTEWR